MFIINMYIICHDHLKRCLSRYNENSERRISHKNLLFDENVLFMLYILYKVKWYLAHLIMICY